MEIEATAIPDVMIVRPRRHGDHRGFFSEVYRDDVFRDAGLPVDWVQENHSHSSAKGTVRGLHFQFPPVAQDKLVRVVRGAVFDVAVDMRHSSPTFGRFVAQELSADNGLQLFVPKGFAHGFCSLTSNVEIVYKVTAFYSPDHDAGFAWDDPDIGIDWPVDPGEAVLSDKDRDLPRLAQLPAISEWDR
ncbi:dTDP-4-dehydrorhamnose 3,5-epimerase [Amorphus coralli]|uniref:dTDP-4-dehydrorhamnose 3,5-epimerase n=1 Tax=Amorphus coralli TaxID=340680 RepID=UPI0003732501|nr:dTDP-4-dehydrorhamnose 3,5-epimerase [Amorphus coralli]